MLIYDESIVVFTSWRYALFSKLTTKMYPFDESVRVPFLIKLPKSWEVSSSKVPIPLDAGCFSYVNWVNWKKITM